MSVSKIQFRNSFTAEDLLGTSALTILTHPLDYGRVLMQLGFEPFEPYPTRRLFVGKTYGLPGIFSYWKLIYRTDGFFGLFRGVTFRVGYFLTNKFVYINVNDTLKQHFAEQRSLGAVDDTLKARSVKTLVDNLFKETICKVVSVSVSYPLRVLFVRSCAQFIGKETIYNSIPSALRDIYSNEGMFGFYGGFVSFVVGECVTLWISQTVIYVIEELLIASDASKGHAKDLHFYIATIANHFVSSLMYPFQVVSTVMSVNGSKSLTVAYNEPQFVNWVECWQHLRRLGQSQRGSSLFLRSVDISRRYATKSL